jgi:large subunit ribosomal protein L28
MSKKCEISGRGALRGNNVSHSNRKTKRIFALNLQTKKLLNPATGKYMSVKLSNHSLKTLAKWRAAGKKYDLRKLIANS